jgi:hypothetical protein
MALPVNGTNLGSPEQELWKQIRQVIREELHHAARGGIGLHVDGATGNLIIDKGEVQSGNYVPGSVGWGLLPNGDAEFNQLTLRSGIIGNDALTNPVGFAGNKGSVNAVVPPASYGTACSANLTIPSWVGSAVVIAIASIGATSSGSPGGAVIGDVIIDGGAGDSDSLTLASGASGHMTVVAQRTYSPTPPTIPVSLSWYCQNAIAGASARLVAIAVVGR